MRPLNLKVLLPSLFTQKLQTKIRLCIPALVVMSFGMPLTVLGGVLDELGAPTPRTHNPASSHAAISAQSRDPVLIGQGGFPTVDEAFQVAWSYNGKTVRGEFTIAPGCYLYQDRFKILLQYISPTASTEEGQPLKSVRLGALSMPEGEKVEDLFLGGTHTIYRSAVTISAPLNLDESDPSPAPTQIKIEARWQGCAEAGLCYPAVRKTFQLTSTPH